MRISRLELILSILVTFGLLIVLAKFAPGGPLGTDVVGYVNHGLNGVEDPTTITRYFHTYLQALFTRSAPTPLIGVQVYWAFIMSLGTLLIYLNARLLTRRANFVHGLLAVLLFWSIRAVTDSAGITFVDFSAMFIAGLIVCVYLVSYRRGHRSWGMLVLLGFLYYLGFRAKEVVICTLLLVVGLGLAEDDKFQFKLLLKRVGYLACGAAAGMVLFIFLNAIFLHDPLFGWRLSDYQAYFAHYSQVLRGSTVQSWLTNPLTNTALILLIFLLYIISGTKAASDPEIGLGNRIVWLVPISMVAFLILSVEWGKLPFRYLIPALALMTSLEVQIFDFDLPATRRGRAVLLGLLTAGVLLGLVARLWIKHSALPKGWDEGIYLEVVYFPLIITAILAVLMMVKRPSANFSIVLGVLILSVLTSLLSSNLRSMFIGRSNQQTTELVFYPFSAFTSEITVTPGMQVYMASDTWVSVDQLWIAKNFEEKANLFNVYFDAGLSKSQVTSPENTDISRDILQERYNYVFMRTDEWEQIAADTPVLAQVEQDYEIFSEPRGLLILLKAKGP
jgi:hypothetical protein